MALQPLMRCAKLKLRPSAHHDTSAGTDGGRASAGGAASIRADNRKIAAIGVNGACL
jgi:hypothetical protein